MARPTQKQNIIDIIAQKLMHRWNDFSAEEQALIYEHYVRAYAASKTYRDLQAWNMALHAAMED